MSQNARRYDVGCRRNARSLVKCKTYDNDCYPGMAIHEMGTARMEMIPKSVLNKWNQMHEVSNVLLLMVLCLP
jgi:hypothetical protein